VNRVGPPRWSEALLAAALAARDREAILGDLAEAFAVRAHEEGVARARRWYRRQVLRALGPALRRRLTDEDGNGRMTMGAREMASEMRTAAKGLLRTPGFTGISVLTLALGIGAAAAIFSVVDSVVLRPLPYPESNRLVRLDHPVPGQGEGARWGLSVAGYFHFQDEMESLSELGAFYTLGTTLTGEAAPEQLTTAVVSTSLLHALGARPAAGRIFDEQDDEPGAPSVVVLSHGLWQRRFGGDPGVVGSVVQIDASPREVVGVMRPGFDLPGRSVELWVPFRMDRTADPVNSHYVQAVGLLAPGATPEGARAEMARLTARLPELFPGAYGGGFMESSGFSAGLRPWRDVVVGDMDRALWLLLAGVGLVLLVALANVANLFLVRTEERLREVAIRRALGAGRGSLARHFLGEGLTLAAVAGVVGMGLAVLGVRALVALSPPELPRIDEVAVRGSTGLLVVGLVLVSGAVFGAFPLWRARGRAPAEALGEGARGTSAGRRAGMVRNALVVAQVAMALVLLTASGLMLRSFQRLTRVDPGFEVEDVWTFDLSLPRTRYADPDEVYRLHRALLDDLEAEPAVRSAGLIFGLPVGGSGYCIAVAVEGAGGAAAADPGCPQVRFASPGYFETMGIAVTAGRSFERRDNEARTARLIVSRAMADRLWPGQAPLGHGARLWGSAFYRVVGVVEDVRGEGLDRPVQPLLYYPVRSAPGENMPPLQDVSVVLRAPVAEGLGEVVRRTVSAQDPDIPVASLRPMADVVAASLSRRTVTLTLLGVAGTLALVLGLVGMYGVVAYAVSRRTGELGIRMALGAGAGTVRGMVLRQALALAAVGVAVGLALAWASTGLLASLLYGVSATDPATFAGAAAALVAISLAAAWVPARRATRIDPSEALRSE
jgi:predicted permease